MSSTRCRAAVLWEPNTALKLEEIDVEHPKKGEVMIRIYWSGVCHTDTYTASGKDPEGVYPVILGHEGAGKVVKVGEGVNSVQCGDTVIPLYTPECRECKFCKSGKTNLCGAIREMQGKGLMPDGTVRFSKDGNKIHHYMGCSTFSEITVIAEISCAKIARESPLDQVCVLGCGITTGLRAPRNTVKVKKGDKCAIFGVGCIGLSAIIGCREAGADRIIAIDIDESKFELARKMGATDFLNPNKEDLLQKIIEITEGGVDYSFECVGKTDLMRVALECCHKGWGESVIIGVAGSDELIQTRPFQLVTGRVWRGCAFGGVKGRSDLPGIVDDIVNRGLLNLGDFITHKFSNFEDINEAFTLTQKGKTLRAVVQISRLSEKE